MGMTPLEIFNEQHETIVKLGKKLGNLRRAHKSLQKSHLIALQSVNGIKHLTNLNQIVKLKKQNKILFILLLISYVCYLLAYIRGM